MKRLRWALFVYLALDLFIGGYNGGLLPLSLGQATTSILASGGIGVSCNAVTTQTSLNPGTSGGCTSFALVTSGGNLPVVYTWQTITTGSPASVTVNLMGSLDGLSWNQIDTMSSATTQTVSGQANRFVGCVPATLSGGSSPTVTCQISVSAGTSGGSGSVTSIATTSPITGGTITTTGTLACATCVVSGAALTNLRLVLGAGSQSATTAAGFVTVGGAEIDIGATGVGSGVLGLTGTTSGKATISGPAVAGTATNPFTFSNIQQGPDGANATPTYSFTNSTGTGMRQTSNILLLEDAGNLALALGTGAAGNVEALSGGEFSFSSSSSDPTTTRDTNMSRCAAGVVCFGGSASGQTTTKVKASGYMSVGTKFTTNAGCGESAGTTTGGATAGKFTTAGSTSCTSIVTLGDTATAPNGWACTAHDLTTSADYNNPHVSSSGTTITIVTGTIVASDVIEFSCIGY